MRYLASLGIAGLVSLSLFWFMQYMIAPSTDGLKKQESVTLSNFISAERESRIETKDRRKPDPPEEDPPPEVPELAIQQDTQTQQQQLDIDIPQIDVPLAAAGGVSLSGVSVGGLGFGDGDIIPLVRQPATYPRRALQARIEGWVDMELTISATGLVEEVTVVNSEPKRLFDQAAKSAVRRWKFKPRLVNGQAVPQKGIQRIEFKLGE